MKMILQLVLFLSLPVSFLACSEENLTPSEAGVNYFKVPDGARDEESVLRRNFFERTESYLLFNDTLRYESIGTDARGNELFFCETVDLSYSLTNLSGVKYLFGYIPSLEKKKEATAFIETSVFSNLDTRMRPYSMLLVDEILRYSLGNITNNENVVCGERCVTIALSGLYGATPEERFAMRVVVFNSILTNELNAMNQLQVQPFYTPVESYYGNKIGTSDPKKLGFLGANTTTFYNKKQDLDSYLTEMLSLSESEFMTKYASYGAIKKRYQSLRPVIESVGFTFDK